MYDMLMSGHAALCRAIRSAALAMAICLSAFATTPAMSGNVALVVGNNDYTHLPDLDRAASDARGYSDLLRARGYDVTTLIDASRAQLSEALAVFYGRIQPGDTAVFAYAGHGWSDGSVNYLIPADAEGDSDDARIRLEAFPLQNGTTGILDEIEARNAKLSVLIFDACRDNPFPGLATRGLGMSRGLARIREVKNTFVVFSAGEGQTALDAPGGDQQTRYSPFTHSFLSYLDQDYDLLSAIKNTQRDVFELADRVGHQQLPAYYDKVLGRACLATQCRQIEGTEILDADIGPPTIIVDASGRGDFTALAPAIKAAKKGARLEIRSGRYSGGVDVGKPLDLIGVGAPGSVILEAEGDDVIYWSAPSGRIDNLAIRQLGGDYFGVYLVDGTAVILENSAITSRGYDAVAVARGANPVIRDNVIEDSQFSGVYFHDDATGSLVGNTIRGNRKAGVLIESGADPLIRGNIITEGLASGVLVRSDGRGTIDGNEIFANALAGVAVSSVARPVIRGNAVHSGLQTGLFFYDGGDALVTGNSISRNKGAGVVIESGADPTLEGNQIFDGSGRGIAIHKGGEGTLRKNEIFNNASAGVLIATEAKPTLFGNTIRNGKQGGVVFARGAQGLLEANDIFGNAFAGISITSGADPKVRGNTVRDGLQAGISVYDGGKGLIEGNRVTGNAFAGISIRASAPVVRRNDIIGGQHDGIDLRDAAAGIVENNTIDGNARSGIVISGGSNPLIRANQINASGQAGILAGSGARGRLEGNKILGSELAGLQIGADAVIAAHRNTISTGRDAGVLVHAGGQIELIENTISDNRSSGLVGRGRSGITMIGNEIRGNRRYGIEIDRDVTLDQRDNTYRQNRLGERSTD